LHMLFVHAVIRDAPIHDNLVGNRMDNKSW
jgi:hypothetical protein